MLMNLRILHTLRTLYVLSLPFMALYFAFVWFIMLPDNTGQPTTTVELKHYGIQTLLYFGFGVFLFPFMNNKFNRKMRYYISHYKERGFKASSFEVYSKFNDTYAGWDQSKNEMLLIDVNKNISMLVPYDTLINVQIVGSNLLLTTTLKECPKFYVMLDKKNIDSISNKLQSVMNRNSVDWDAKLYQSQ